MRAGSFHPYLTTRSSNIGLDLQIIRGTPGGKSVGTTTSRVLQANNLLGVQGEIRGDIPSGLDSLDDRLTGVCGDEPNEADVVISPGRDERALVIVKEYVLGAEGNKVLLLGGERASPSSDQGNHAFEPSRAVRVGLAAVGWIARVEVQGHHRPVGNVG